MPVTYRKDDGEVQEIVQKMLGKYHGEIAQFDPPPEVDVIIAESAPNEGGEGETDANVLQEKGRPTEATIRIMRLKDRVAGRGDVEITIDGDKWADLNAKQREALIDHQLEHLELQKDSEDKPKTDDIGRMKLKIRKHDYEIGGFDAVAHRHHGDCPEVRQAKQLMDQSGQLLFGFGPQTGTLGFDASAKASGTKSKKTAGSKAKASSVSLGASGAETEKPGSPLHQVRDELDKQPNQTMAMAV